MSRLLLLAMLAAILGAAGCGGDDEAASTSAGAGDDATATAPLTEGATDAVPPGTTATPPPENDGDGGEGGDDDGTGGARAPAGTTPAEAPPAVRRFAAEANRACERARRSTRVRRLPDDASALPTYARRTLPDVRRVEAALRRLDPPPEHRLVVQGLVGAYAGLIPALQQITTLPPTDPQARAVAQLLPGAARQVQQQALAAGIPACGLPGT